MAEIRFLIEMMFKFTGCVRKIPAKAWNMHPVGAKMPPYQEFRVTVEALSCFSFGLRKITLEKLTKLV